MADKIFEMNSIDMPLAWLGAIAYTLQIYFDFSAYSDMAIGLGRVFGFHFEENFNFPYIAKSAFRLHGLYSGDGVREAYQCGG